MDGVEHDGVITFTMNLAEWGTTYAALRFASEKLLEDWEELRGECEDLDDHIRELTTAVARTG